jgi:hypothetical protein
LKVLIISDDPESKLFYQITSLRKAIQELGENVDLLVLSDKGTFLNKKRIDEKVRENSRFLKLISREKPYAVIVVSLELNNLKKLFLEKPNIFHFLRNCSPMTRTYVSGASSVLSKIPLLVYPRPGVTKLTRKFKEDLIDYIKKHSG